LRTFDYTIVDVFTKSRLQGNPLAVFTSPAGLSNAEMQKIAGEMNLAETVFLFEGTSGAAAIAKIFTPKREMDFAGHPTIGSAYVLAQRHTLGGAFVIQENVGPVPIERDVDEAGDARFWLTTPPIVHYESIECAFAARLLGIDESHIVPNVPPQFVSAGSPLLFIALDSPEAVDRVEYVYDKASLGSINSVGTFVFARKSPGSATDFDVYSRMFAPQSGIAEDPATGGATGPLAAYMMKYGLLPLHDLRFDSEQGAKMGRRSLLQVKITAGDPAVIQIGGCAVTIAEGHLFLD
jgi:trans-2,3-dihydro-3-hydroxyanthranilate isomerase